MILMISIKRNLILANKWVCLSDSDRDYIKSLLKDDRKSKALNKKLDDADKRITVQSAKGKGRELQKWVCTRIAKLTNIPFDNKDDNCKIHSREMGQSGVDVILRDEALKKFPFSIECKSTESINLRDFIQQAKSNQKEGTDWMVVVRTKSISDVIVVMSWDSFERLYRGEINV